MTPTVRPARAGEFEALREIEVAADGVFEPIGIWPLPPPAKAEQYADAAALFVAGDPPVGFARLVRIDGHAHLDQLSVHPRSMRHGIGGALVEASVAWAAEQGDDVITLATFRDVAWNAPFYAKHGFVVLEPTTPALAAVVEHEKRIGLDRLGARVLMARYLT